VHKKWFFSGAWKALSLKNGNAILVQEVKEWREIKNETKNGYSKLYDSSGCAMRPESRAIDTKNFPLVWLNCCSRNGSRGYPSYALE
jgi:hypothetical protein